MNRDDFFYLGKILKTTGSKGHLLVFLDVDDPSRYKKLETVFIGIENDRIPFAISELELKHRNTARILFEDIHSDEEARICVGRELYLPSSMLPLLKGKKFYFHEIKGFTVIDKKHGKIGMVISVLDMPQQALMQIRHGEKEILIPVIDEILVSVDRKKKEIRIQAPEGLIEIYL
jgi:16S rRNA processing protein RimM